MMKPLVAALLCAACTSVKAAPPSLAELDAYAVRMRLYVSLGQKPDEVLTSLRNYFGKPYFAARRDHSSGATDIFFQIGEGTGITFMVLLGSVPDSA